jgi:hypothetical protein
MARLHDGLVDLLDAGALLLSITRPMLATTSAIVVPANNNVARKKNCVYTGA